MAWLPTSPDTPPAPPSCCFAWRTPPPPTRSGSPSPRAPDNWAATAPPCSSYTVAPPHPCWTHAYPATEPLPHAPCHGSAALLWDENCRDAPRPGSACHPP